MYDNVLLATSKEGMINKFRILKVFCGEHGMIINENKTKFFVICGTEVDTEPLQVNGFVIAPIFTSGCPSPATV